MREFLIKKRTNINILSVFVFAVCYFVCAFLYFKEELYDNFSPQADSIGEKIHFSELYITLSFVFLGVLLLISVIGYIVKSKFLLFLMLGYDGVLAATFVLLGAFSTDSITSAGLLKILNWLLNILLSPVYGFIWIAGFIFVLVVLVHIVVSIIFIIRVYKNK